jgi:glyoxylase-like metal-dependent hydrolase (beta-lactamase superfamily II)
MHGGSVQCVGMSELEPGRLARIALDVQRVVAPNPSLLTGPGTNTYLLGDPPTALIDPGPPAPAHLDVLLAAAPALALIFVTHTHPDHSLAARVLAQRTGARLIGRAAPSSGPQDWSFEPDVEPAGYQEFALGSRTLRVIATPGHASNHVCYLLLETGLLFSGDHILDGVTPVIAPPDGVMADYLDSLRRLRAQPLESIAPGHGRVLAEPVAVIDGIIAHRERREARIVAALERQRLASLEQLLPEVYADVRPQLHPLARQSLEAHLIKLAAENRCELRGGLWCARL